MMPGMNPRDIQRIMKQLNAKKIDAEEVIIKTKEGELVIKNPDVTQMGVSGNTVFQIMGDIEEKSTQEDSNDVKLIMEKTGKDEDTVKKTLEKNEGDMAQTILDLS